MEDLRAFLRLNRAGRRYLADDGSSNTKGVNVLSAVSDDLNCVFLHLRENPSLLEHVDGLEQEGCLREPGASLDSGWKVVERRRGRMRRSSRP